MLVAGVTDASILEQVYRLRARAWEADGIKLPTEDGMWTDAHDAHAIHWVIFDQEQIVAAARMCVHERTQDLPESDYFGDAFVAPPPIASLNRLVTAPEARRHGYARQLDDARMSKARELGCRTVLITAHHPFRIASLERRGFSRFECAKSMAFLPTPAVLRRLTDAD